MRSQVPATVTQRKKLTSVLAQEENPRLSSHTVEREQLRRLALRIGWSGKAHWRLSQTLLLKSGCPRTLAATFFGAG